MIPAAHNTPRQGLATLRAIAVDLLAGSVLLFGVTITTRWFLDLPPTYVIATVGLYGAVAIALAAASPRLFRDSGMGAANRVTLARASLILPLASLVWHPEALTPVGGWWIIGLGTAAMVLDAVDGWVARRTHSATEFGARFDMELDTLLICILALLVWRSAKVGSWVVLLGVMRYMFVLAGYAWNWLRAELPPSLRRKTACVIQGVALLVCLGPIIPSPMAVLAATLGLATVSYSFAVDVRWLYLHAANRSSTQS